MATHIDQKLELLKRAPLLSGLGRREIEEVGRLVEEIDVPAGQILMREGETGRELWYYRYKVPDKVYVCCGQVNRGLAVLGNRLFMR